MWQVKPAELRAPMRVQIKLSLQIRRWLRLRRCPAELISPAISARRGDDAQNIHQGGNSDESNRGDGSGCGNGRDETGGAARTESGDQRCRRSDSRIGL